MTKVLTDARPIRLKGRSFLALVLSPELPFEGWLARLDDLAARSAGFFLGRPVVLDVEDLNINRSQLAELIAAFAERNVWIMGVEGARPSLLGPGMPPAMKGGRPASDFEPPEAPAEAQETAARAPAEPAMASVEQPPVRPVQSIIIKEPVRSGQSIIFPEGDI